MKERVGCAPGAVAGWALDVLGARRVTLEAAAGNEGSLRVAAAAGFTREGVQRSKGQRFAERFDMVLCSVLPGEIRQKYEIDPLSLLGNIVHHGSVELIRPAGESHGLRRVLVAVLDGMWKNGIRTQAQSGRLK